LVAGNREHAKCIGQDQAVATNQSGSAAGVQLVSDVDHGRLAIGHRPCDVQILGQEGGRVLPVGHVVIAP